jgi:hypothetical protein
MLIQSTDTFTDSNGIKCVLYGESGVGKTSSIATLKAAGFNPLLVSAESGTLSLKGSGISMVDISTNDKGEPVAMEDRLARLHEVFLYLKDGKHKFDTVVLDSLTEINHCVMAYLKKKHPDPKSNLVKFGENSEIMQKIVREFRDLKLNVVLIALASNDKDDIGRRYTDIDLVGKTATKIPALFDEVIYYFVTKTDKDGVIRKFQCQPSDQVRAKDRSGKLSAYEDADLGKLFLKIKG